MFDISIEGAVAFTGIDVYAEVGPDVAYDLNTTYVALDDTLNIQFIKLTQNPKVGALLVEEMSDTCNSSPTTVSSDTSCWL